MAGRQVNGIKYIATMNAHNLKLNSFEDCVYHTLRDVFWNCDCDADYLIKINNLTCQIIKQNTDYDTIEYTHNLNNLHFMKKIYKFLERIDDDTFKFSDEDFDMKETYVEYDVWLNEFQTLLKKIKKRIDEMEKTN
jgi:hypothetical protein